MFINKSSKLSDRRNRAGFAQHEKRRGGTIINIITAVIFFGLIAAGVLWVIKTAGDMGGQYTKAMVNTENKARTIKCQQNLYAINQSIQAYGLENEKLPESFDELVRITGMTQVFQCPEPNSPKYQYIPGQSLDSPPDNILLYEPEPEHGGKCNVLRVNGMIELLTPEELQAAIEQTKAHLR
jgi:hypothetical protein